MNLASYILSFLFLWTIFVLLKDKRRRLPPGPPAVPLFGNIFQLSSKPWEKVDNWRVKYGPVMTIKLGVRTLIILNTREAARDLLDKRSNIYNDRPRLISFGEYIFNSKIPGVFPYGREWQDIHRLHQRFLNPKASKTLAIIQTFSVKWFMAQMLHATDLTVMVNWLTVNSSSTLTLGTPVGSVPLGDMQSIYNMMLKVVEALNFDGLLVELFPFLEYIPGVRRAGMKRADGILTSISNVMGNRLHDAIHSPSWSMARAMYQQRPPGMIWDTYSMSVTEIFLAGGGATPLTLTTVFLMIALNPVEMQKAQQEIDSVVGTDRMPTLQDWDRLPRVHALISETIRYKGTAPFNFPHAPTQEDEYLGYRIPPDAMIIANQGAMNYDEAVFEDPLVFKPQRWIDNLKLPQPAMFGFGRRQCPGRHSAGSIMFMATASLLWGYNLDVKKGVTEDPVNKTSFFHLANSSGILFSCRSAKHREVIEGEWNAVNPDVSGLLNDVGENLGL